MANQQIPDPYDPRRNVSDPAHTQAERVDPVVERPVAGSTRTDIYRRRRTGAWWWLWFLVVIGVAIWWAGWGWGGSGGWWYGNRAANGYGGTRRGTVATAPASGAVNGPAGNQTNGGTGNTSATMQPNGPGINILDAVNKQQYIGKAFHGNDLPVQKKVNDHVLWVAGNGSPMLVVLSGKGPGIPEGGLVDASGTVEKAPPAAQAKREWALNDTGASRLENQGAYIRANRVMSAK